MESSALGASAVGALLSALSLFNGLAPIAAVLAAFAGAMVTISFNSYLQKRMWKRETTIQMVKELYGPLYVENGRILETLARKDLYLSLDSVNGEWTRVRADYHYLVIPAPLKDELDEFYALMSQIKDENPGVIGVIDRAILQVAGEFAGAELKSAPTWSLRLFIGDRYFVNFLFSPHIAVLYGWTTAEIFQLSLQSHPAATKYESSFQVERLDGSSMTVEEKDNSVVDGLLKKMTEVAHSDERYKKFAKDKTALGDLGANIRQELRLIVTEPWSV